MSRAQLHQAESTLTVGGATVPMTLDVSYIWVGKQVEILDVRTQSGQSIGHILPMESMQAIQSEIDGAK